MKFAVLYSKKDIAGINIAGQLKEHYLPQTQIIELTKDSVYNEHIDKDPRLQNIDFIIFATRHQSKAGNPSLSLHAPGNWRNADFGGQAGKVCLTSSQALKFLFQKLNQNASRLLNPSKPAGGFDYDHEVTLECTHHGPLLTEIPCCFIEIGSKEEHWQDKELGKIIAKTIADFQDFKIDKNIKTAIGIGGPHYCPNFNKMQLNSNYAFSHIIPEYCLPLTQSMIEEAIAKTQEHVDIIILDWKGCGKSEDRQKVIELIESSGLKWERDARIGK